MVRLLAVITLALVFAPSVVSADELQPGLTLRLAEDVSVGGYFRRDGT
jgi:hypothetical protein